MDQLQTLDAALAQLRVAVASLDDSTMNLATNCPPWTARQLASHAINSQLLWVGVLTGEELVPLGDVMGAVPYDGDLVPIADDAIDRARTAWGADGVLDTVHSTPFGELPGAVVVNFPTIDAFAHAWDITTSIGAPSDFPEDAIEPFTVVARASCNDGTRGMGLFAAATEPPADATPTETLMAFAGRTVNR